MSVRKSCELGRDVERGQRILRRKLRLGKGDREEAEPGNGAGPQVAAPAVPQPPEQQPGDGQGTDREPRSEDESSEVREPLSTRIRCLRVAPGAVAFLCAIFPPSLLLDWSVGPLAEEMLAAAAAGLLAFHLVNIFRTRVKLGHWGVKSLACVLRSEIFIGCVLPVLVIALALLFPPSALMLLGLAAIYGLAQVLYEPVQRQIQQEVKNADKPSGTTAFRQWRPLRIVGIDKTLEEMAETEHGLGLWRALISLGEAPWQKGLSRTRSLILYTLLLCAAFAAAAAGDVYLHDQVSQHHSAKIEASLDRHGEAGGGAMGVRGAEESSGGGTPARESGGRCPFEPGHGAPAWAKADLRTLYYGGIDLNATDPPGTETGGCPGKVIVPPGLENSFVYTVGRNSVGEVRSIALDSVRFGPAIFLAPAAQRVITLINHGVMPLGGYPKIDAGEGDMAPIITPAGTVILVRAEKVLPDRPEYATPYVELPATVATAWLAAMRIEDSWLWPLKPRTRGVERVYRFSASVNGGAGGPRAVFDTLTGDAAAGAFSYQVPEPQLSQVELEEFAHRAD